MRLDDVQLRLLTTLTWRCRSAGEAQAAIGTGMTVSEIRRARRGLEQLGLVDSSKVTVVEFQLNGPLATSDDSPADRDWGAVAWALEQRWSNARHCRERIMWATPRATEIVGGVGGRLRQPLQLQHDLGVTEVWAMRGKQEGSSWLSEDVYRALWQLDSKAKVPDAVIVNRNEMDERKSLSGVIEFGGRYSRKRLQEFHRFWSRKGIYYEIW